MRPSKKKLLFVLGMHRSGTSALTGVLAKLGAGLPRGLMGSHEINPKGFFESTVVMTLNNELLAKEGSNWRDFCPLATDKLIAPTVNARISEALESEYGKDPFIVLKDPRICRMVPPWVSSATSLGYEPFFILPYRHPLEVAKSLEKRDGMPIAEGLLLWLRYVLEAERETRDGKRAFVSMSDLLDNWKSSVAHISRKAGIDWRTSPEEAAADIDAFLDKDLRHQVVSEEHPEIDSLLTGWVINVFNGLQGLDKVDSPDIHARMDAIRHAFDEACHLFGPALHGRIDRVEVVERGYNAKNQALSELKASSEKLTVERDMAVISTRELERRHDKNMEDLLKSTAEAARATTERDGALAGIRQAEARHNADTQDKITAINDLSHRLQQDAVSNAAESARLITERDGALAGIRQAEARYNADMQDKITAINDLSHRLQQDAVSSAAESARLITERDGALAGLRMADERHRTEIRKTKLAISTLTARIESLVSAATAEAARLTAERDQVSGQSLQMQRAHEIKIVQMQDQQFAAGETIGRLKSEIGRIEDAARQSASVYKAEIDALNAQLAGQQINLEAQSRLVNIYQGGRRIDFIAWAARKSRRPK